MMANKAIEIQIPNLIVVCFISEIILNSQLKKKGAHSYDFTVGLSRLLNTPDFTELNLIIQTEVEFYLITKELDKSKLPAGLHMMGYSTCL